MTSLPEKPITGVILAGGPSSRFGGQLKGLQMVAGRRIIDRVATALSEATDRLLIVSNHAGAAGWIPGVPAAADVLSLKASIVGIHSALSRAGGSVIVAAWDMPFLSIPLLHELRRRLVPGALAVVPWTASGPEPVCAAWSPEALPHLERLANTGNVRLSSVVDALPGVVRLDAAEVSRFGNPDTMFLNVNTPQDLERAEHIMRPL